MTLVFTPFLCIKTSGKKKHIATRFDQTTTVDLPHSAKKHTNFSQVSTGSTRIARHSLANSFQFPAIVQGSSTQPNPKTFPTHQIWSVSPVANPSVSPVRGPVLGAAFDVPSSRCRCSRRGLHLLTSHSPGAGDFSGWGVWGDVFVDGVRTFEKK